MSERVGELNLPDNFFDREDESPDENFYQSPRFTAHIDDATITNLTQYYRETFIHSYRLLDLMSSCISHLPDEIRYEQVTGLGMNREELVGNSRLDEFTVQNLNVTPELPYPTNCFHAVMIAVSVQYLTRPFEVFKEIGRVLTPNGICVVSMSHRLFPTKAIHAFRVLPPADRCQLVFSYMNLTGMFESVEFVDRSPPNADPLWLVVGRLAAF